MNPRSGLTVFLAFCGVCIGCLSCGTSPNYLFGSTDVLTLSEARQQIGRLNTPLGSVAAEFGVLRSALETELVAGAETRWVSSAPTDASNRVATLYLTKIDDTTATAQWIYRNVGDYDQNSQVNISDLSALGANLGGTAAAVDGDSNGLVTIADITPLGSHLLNTVDQYALQSTTTPAVESTWLEVERVDFAVSQIPNGGGLRTFSVAIPAGSGQSFRVVPLNAGSLGISGLPILYTGQTGPPPLSFEERSAVLQLISDKLDNLETSTSSEQDQELADYIATLPHIEAAGFFDGNAWGRFTDGRLAIVCKNRAPQGSQASSVSPRAASGFGVPETEFVTLLNSFGPGNTYTTPIPGLKPILNDNGYQTWTDNQATSVALRSIVEDGVFYIDAHGGTGVSRDGASQYCVWMDEAYTAANETLFADDLSAGRMAYMLAMNAAGSDVWNYCFSDEFVLEYMTFSDNSVVFINACKSGTDLDMIDAFHSVGATVYLGWMINVPDDVANKAAEHIFDRVLGANQLGRVENPPVRPFEYYWVMADMVARGVSAGEPVQFPDPPGEPYSQLLYFEDDFDPSTGFTLLAPTIQNMVMFDNANELHIVGHFG
ncbi:MAG: hypothetical protein M3R04_07565, partial [bacterium]|nr:hypothetical protein [bacterium]